MTEPSDFIRKVLLTAPEGGVWLCSLLNEKGKGGERHILSRDPEVLNAFAKKWDKGGRGAFYCVTTIDGPRRRKEAAQWATFVHADVDFKDIACPPDEALERLLSLGDMVPSRIHASGRGLHALWLLTQPTDDFEWLEATLRRLATLVAGDTKVAHCVALMRLPGTHNTKDGTWTEVKVPHESDRTFERDELDAWLAQSPAVIQPKGQTLVPLNPFLKMAMEQNFKVPIDVEQRLTEMEHLGEGDKGVHATQLSVSASLLAAGVPEDEVVERIMEAVNRVADASWDMAAEERVVRGMCRDWFKKHPETKTKPKVRAPNVVNLQDARAARAAVEKPEDDEEDKPKPSKKKQPHVVLGMGVLESLKERGEALLMTQDQLWRCQEGTWRALPPAEGKAWLEREVEVGCRALKIPSITKVVNEARAWIMRNPELYMSEVRWDDHSFIATKSGLLDVSTGELEPIKPSHYITYQVESIYDPKATCPKWEQFLRDMFPDTPNVIQVIQEIAGMGLIYRKSKSLTRALILVGPSNSGKSNFLDVVSGVLSAHVNSTPMDMLENAHGLTPFIDRAPWVLHEAFEQTKWHFSGAVKALLSGDPVSVNVKNGPLFTHVFTSPVFWGTNTPPQFKESSRAIRNRTKIIRCHVVFPEDSDVGIGALARKAGYASPAQYILAEERAGVLNWLIEGMKRAKARGGFEDTPEIAESMHEMFLDSNIAAGFIEEATTYDVGTMVSKPDFYAAFSVWWKENRGEGARVPSIDSLGRALVSACDARLASGRNLIHGTIRYYVGIKLNTTGMDLWQAHFTASAARGDEARISAKPEDVNRLLPGPWLARPEILKMAQAFVEVEKRKKNEK